METITPEQIAARAYQRFLERGGEHGHDVEDWMAALAELQRDRRRYDVLLVDAGPRVIEVVRLIRERTGMELRDVKLAVDSPPAVLRRDLSAAEAEALQSQLEAVGARIELSATGS
jgi:large subunit ribosomal protein L7/L12